MERIIKRQITNLYKQKRVRKYSITHEGLCLFIKLRPRTQELLKDMLLLLQNNCDTDSLTLNISSFDMGFDDRSNFSKCKKELIKSRLLFFKENEYFINPCYINFYSMKQMNFLFGLFKLKSTKRVIMTDPKYLRLVK